MYDIQLIKAPSLCDFVLPDKWSTPLNLIWLSNYLQEYGYTVEILDGTHLNLQQILSRINAPIIGIDFNIYTTSQMRVIASHSKKSGSFVVLGGQAATPLAHNILSNNCDIDAIILGDGEEALLQLMKSILKKDASLGNIPNLVFRESEEIKISYYDNMNLTALPFPKRSVPGIKMEEYISSYYNSNSDPIIASRIRITNAYLKKGCPRRTSNSGCSFCARIDLNIRQKTPYQAYMEYKYLIDEYNVNYICDDSDSWVNLKWMRQLLNYYKSHGALNTKYKVYVDPRDINSESVSLMKDIGIDMVLIGIESGDERILRLNGKPNKIESIIESVKLLGKSGIRICDAYVLGLLEENIWSINKTLALSNELKNHVEVFTSYWNMVLPLPGSGIWRNMMQINELRKKYGECYEFEVEELRRDYLSHFSYLGRHPYEHITNVINNQEINHNIPKRNYIR